MMRQTAFHTFLLYWRNLPTPPSWHTFPYCCQPPLLRWTNTLIFFSFIPIWLLAITSRCSCLPYSYHCISFLHVFVSSFSSPPLWLPVSLLLTLVSPCLSPLYYRLSLLPIIVSPSIRYFCFSVSHCLLLCVPASLLPASTLPSYTSPMFP